MGWRAAVVVPWLLVALLAVGLPVLSVFEEAGGKAASGEAAEGAGPRLGMQEQYLTKYLMGMRGLFGEAQALQLLPQLEGSLEEPARTVVLAILRAELDGRDRALAAMGEVDHADVEALRTWWARGEPPDADWMRRYGFVARLAKSQMLAETDPQRMSVMQEGQRTVIVVLGMVGAVVLGVAVGLVLLVLGMVFWLNGSLSLTGPPPRGDPAVYLQGFTLYLYGLFGLSLMLSVVPGARDAFAINLLPAALATLAGLVYIAARSTGGAMSGDLGLHRGRGWVWEAGCGIVGYVAALPIIAVGIGITLVLTMLSGANPAHPITDVAADHTLWVVLLAVVAAPITEEIFFRGALLTHCRAWLGPVMAGLLTGLIFAAIHPQGWAGIPALTAIGFSLAVIRQWRGSLVGPIVAHAINNGAVVMLLLLAF